MQAEPFRALGVVPEILRALEDLGFEQPTPIQQEAIPLLLEGRDLIGQAQTGTGKTAAFGIPIVQRLTDQQDVQALVLTPTRELAIQVAEEISKIGKYRGARVLPIYGGQSIDRQIKGLRSHPHIVIGTPGRVLDHIGRRTLRLHAVRTVVLDEADEMLDMGFIEDVERILMETPSDRQTLLFSATMPLPVRRLADRFLRSPHTVSVSAHEVTVPQIEQRYYEVSERQKLDGLCRILDVEAPELALIFCRTKRGVDDLARTLQERGYAAQGLHGDMTQRERERVLNSFRHGSIEMLVATDVAARGLDIEGVSHVINYDIPQDPDSYVHRIGRTGRAGREGVAITLVTTRERKQLQVIERAIRRRIQRRPLPSVADVRERRYQILRERLTNAIEADGLAEYRPIAAELLDQYDSLDVAAAALRLLADSLLPSETPRTSAAPAPEEGMVRLFINIGRRDGIGPGDVVGAIAGESGIPGRVIGRIDIFDRFTFVEVPAEYSQRVLEAMQNNTI
ncbi:MAG: DEAD/DEAH box helicase, partial [Clostridia bacterium]|nr:DEAD/DEAH box helicase [Clostridia bacterium]